MCDNPLGVTTTPAHNNVDRSNAGWKVSCPNQYVYQLGGKSGYLGGKYKLATTNLLLVAKPATPTALIKRNPQNVLKCITV